MYHIKDKSVRALGPNADGEMSEWIWAANSARERERQKNPARALIGETIKRILYQEQANWFLWLPVAIALGCAAYFALLTEPSWTLVFWFALLAVTFSIIVRKHRLALVFSYFTLAIVIGFALTKLDSERVAAPVIQKRIGPVLVTGRIENLTYYANGEMKLVILPFEIDRLKAQELPRRLRLKLRKSQSEAGLLPGQVIAAKAIIFPPPEPTHPGGFDFSRKNWFEGVGGGGFFIGFPKILPHDTATSLYARGQASLARFRQDISNRLKSQLSGEKGGLAAALIVGDRAAIAKTTLAKVRDAGLAHLLAISGLHMVLFAGTIFWLLRALLALNVTISLRWPVKKWAAALALMGALFYLLISGASIATQRAFIMIMIMFIAIMLDRPAITLRNIAIAAVIILLLKPVNLLSVSFQMSFAATTALVAFYEWYRRIEIIRFYPTSSPAMRVFNKVLIYIAGTALTTLIAGLATAPFAAYYFQRIAVFSLLANVLALPIVGIVVMPAGLIALLLMPLGLDGYALAIMGAGLDMVIAIAGWTQSLPNAVQTTPAFSGSALMLMVFGALWLCLWQTRWRLFGLGIMAAGIALVPLYPLPDVYISGSAKNIAVRGVDGRLVVARSRREKYSVGKWLAREGDSATPGEAARRSGFRCDVNGCVIKLKDNRILGFAGTLAGVEEDCRNVDILIAAVPIRGSCQRPAVKIDKFDLWRNGAYSIFFTGDAIEVRHARAARGDRAWVRKPGGRKSKNAK